MNAKTDNKNELEPTDYSGLSWQKLKGLVQAEGGEYIDVKTSIAFLEELDAKDDQQGNGAGTNEDKSAGNEAEVAEKAKAEADAAQAIADKEKAEAEAADKLSTKEKAEYEQAQAEADEKAKAAEEARLADEKAKAEDDIKVGAEADPVFDPDEDYGSVVGTSNARYCQNGNYFNGMHEYIAPSDIT